MPYRALEAVSSNERLRYTYVYPGSHLGFIQAHTGCINVGSLPRKSGPVTRGYFRLYRSNTGAQMGR